ncbi:MAG: NAD(P)/FAD-dependent oxidoreductase [Candidatus Micrarchaeota archaeon]
MHDLHVIGAPNRGGAYACPSGSLSPTASRLATPPQFEVPPDPPQKFDLHVIGAGPAGIFAAITALRNGKNVLLSEEHASAGSPVHCSGLVSASGLRQLSDVADYRQAVLNTIRRANIHGKNKSFSLNFPFPKAYAFDRQKFDELAAQKYIDEGGKIEFNSKITQTDDIKSKNIIGADGPTSTISRLFSFPKISSFCSCWQGEFSYSSPDISAVEVFLNPDWCPGFMGWIIPLNKEKAKIGLGLSPGSDLHIAKQNFLKNLNIVSAPPLSEFSALIPLSPRPKTAHANNGYNICLAGDAAGQVKATSGGGIFFGAQCARLAAKYCTSPSLYEKEWRAKYGMDLTLHRIMRMGLDMLTPDGVDLWANSVKFFKIDNLLCEIGEMDEYSKMLSFKSLNKYMKLISK